MNKQLEWDKTFLKIANTIAEQSKCQSVKVCAIAVKDNRIIGTGINGSLPGAINCNEVFDKVTPENRLKHREWSIKNEIHAEANLISEFAKTNRSISGSTVYINFSPCETCTRLLSRVGIKRIVYAELYDKGDISYTKAFFEKSKIELEHISIEEGENNNNERISYKNHQIS